MPASTVRLVHQTVHARLTWAVASREFNTDTAPRASLGLATSHTVRQHTLYSRVANIKSGTVTFIDRTVKILFEKWRHKHRKAFSALRLTFIGLTIVLAVAWGVSVLLCWLILSYTLTFAAFALTTIGELLGSTEDLAGEPLAHVQVGEYDLTIPQRYLHDRAYGIELTSGVIFRQPIESAVEMAIPAREMVAAVPGYSSRAGFIPLNLLFNISAPSAKVLSNDLSPIFFQ